MCSAKDLWECLVRRFASLALWSAMNVGKSLDLRLALAAFRVEAVSLGCRRRCVELAVCVMWTPGTPAAAVSDVPSPPLTLGDASVVGQTLGSDESRARFAGNSTSRTRLSSHAEYATKDARASAGAHVSGSSK